MAATRYQFFLGKGGVGKSTCAALTATFLSRTCSVLLVSLDPAHNLGDIFQKNLENCRPQFWQRYS